jgi:conflict system STAND superfamily ATPase
VPGNPFTYGNPISDPRRFFGREWEVKQIFGRLQNKEFESSSVVGERRIGKTSLLNYLADTDVRKAEGLGSEHCIFVYVDLQMVDEAMGPEQLWRRLLAFMRQECPDIQVGKILTALEGRKRIGTFDLAELFQKVKERGYRVAFLLDEFDRVTTNENFRPDFYFGLRALVIKYQIALVTSSRLELIELCHSPAVKSSPFFNIFANINLRQFSLAEAQLMIARSLDGTPVRFSAGELNQVFDLAGLQPYFLQMACWLLYEAHHAGLAEEARKVFLAERFRAGASPHFTDYWDNSGDYEKIVLTAAALLERTATGVRQFSLDELLEVFARVARCLEQLEKRGLVMYRGDRYRLFSSELGPWILDQIAAELGEEQSYQQWLTENSKLMEPITGKQSGSLRDVLPKIGVRYRRLILTWASDPSTLPAMASLLNSVLTLVH